MRRKLITIGLASLLFITDTYYPNPNFNPNPNPNQTQTLH